MWPRLRPISPRHEAVLGLTSPRFAPYTVVLRISVPAWTKSYAGDQSHLTDLPRERCLSNNRATNAFAYSAPICTNMHKYISKEYEESLWIVVYPWLKFQINTFICVRGSFIWSRRSSFNRSPPLRGILVSWSPSIATWSFLCRTERVEHVFLITKKTPDRKANYNMLKM
jgi:hypothetical protein